LNYVPSLSADFKSLDQKQLVFLPWVLISKV